MTNSGSQSHSSFGIGSANGTIKLRSTTNGKTFYKDVYIGVPPVTIWGPSQVTAPRGQGIQDATFQMDNPIPGATYEWSIIGTNNVQFPSGNSGSSVIIWVKSLRERHTINAK